MAFQQDTSGQGYSPDPPSCSQKDLGSRLVLPYVCCLSLVELECQLADVAILCHINTDSSIPVLKTLLDRRVWIQTISKM